MPYIYLVPIKEGVFMVMERLRGGSGGRKSRARGGIIVGGVQRRAHWGILVSGKRSMLHDG